MTAVSDRTRQITACLEGEPSWDLVVIGGGISGAGIMLRAAQAGLKVLLVEQQDFAWGTSSRSSKMVHGGLRYLASGQFSLTRESVQERERLIELLPGLVEPMSYLYVHYQGQRVIKTGLRLLLKLYDRFAGRCTHRAVNNSETLMMLPGIRSNHLDGSTGFEDAVTDDARLVLRTLDEGRDCGGQALNYIKVTSLLKEEGRVCGVRVVDQLNQQTYDVKATCTINACGVKVDSLWDSSGNQSVQRIRPLRGSHIVLPGHKLVIGSALTLQHPVDGRSVFVFPWDNNTVIGTTDIDHDEDLDLEAGISNPEVDYLLEIVNHQFPGSMISREEILSTWAGVRPVISEGENLSPSDEKREHASWSQPGLVSVGGGKLTTFRCIAEQALQLAQENSDLGDLKKLPEQLFAPNNKMLLPKNLSPGKLHRLQGRYGQRLTNWLSANRSFERIGTSTFLWCELAWAAQDQMVVHLDDLLLRRTRIGLQIELGAISFLPRIRACCQALLGWDDERWVDEEERYRAIINRYYAVPEVCND